MNNSNNYKLDTQIIEKVSHTNGNSNHILDEQIEGNGLSHEINKDKIENSVENLTNNQGFPQKNNNFRTVIKPEDKSSALNEFNAVEIACQNKQKEIFYCPKEIKLSLNSWVVVETENGVDIGRVTLNQRAAYRKWELIKQSPVYSVKHRAHPKEIERHKANLEEHHIIVKKVQEISNNLNLDIKITEAEWQLDHHKLTIYFLAPQRVDFRELVKELAKLYKTRIELRQITHRERARRISCWEGVCGRQICCSSFLHQIKPITVEHAKIQQLSSNVAKLSGYCGRLKCCLLFEYETYSEESKKFPRLGAIMETETSKYKLIKFDIFKEKLTFFDENNHIIKTFTLEEVNKYASQNKVIEPADDHHCCHNLPGFDGEFEELIEISD